MKLHAKGKKPAKAKSRGTELRRSGQEIDPAAFVRVKPKKISRLIRECCELLAHGKAKSISDAARQLGCTREHLSKQLKLPHVFAYQQECAHQQVRNSLYRASIVKTDLLDAQSEKVRGDTASDILAVGGIAVPRSGASVNIGVHVSAGYVIDLRSPAERKTPPTIDRSGAIDLSAD